MDKTVWIRNKTINSIQSALLVVSLAAMLGLMGWLLGGKLFALAAVGSVMVLYVVNPMVSPLLILKMHRARPLSYNDAPRLYAVMESLAERAELARVPALYYIPSEIMNAFTVGTREKAAIAVSDGLLRRLNRREIAAVLAHEISHARHNDILVMGFANLTGRLIQMLSIFGQFLLIFNFPLFLLGKYTVSWTAILLLIFAPSISAILQLALSRTREYHADLGATELMGDPESLASALAKMDTFHNRFLRHILWPGFPGTDQFSLFRTHPPTKERIRRLLEIRSPRQKRTDWTVRGPIDNRSRNYGTVPLSRFELI